MISAAVKADSQAARLATSHWRAMMPGRLASSAAAASAFVWYSTATRYPAS